MSFVSGTTPFFAPQLLCPKISTRLTCCVLGTVALVGQKYNLPSMLLMVKDDPILTLAWCEAFNEKDKDMFADLEIHKIETGGHRSLTENAKEVNEHLAMYLNVLFSNKVK